MDNPTPVVAPDAEPSKPNPGHRWLTAQLLVLLPTLALALRVLGLRRVYTTLAKLSAARVTRGAVSADPAAEAQRLAGIAMHVNRELLPFESRCLLESLVLWWLLRCRGISAELVLGVRTILGPFEAHAWVEYDGAPLNDFAGVRGVYEPFDLGAARLSRHSATLLRPPT